MHRIERESLVIQISVAMKIALRQCKPLLTPNRLPHESDILANALAEAAVDLVDGDSRMVIATELKGSTPHLAAPGKWGIDEPDPTASERVDVQPLRQ
jgi:hypothetical protein